MAAGTGGTGTYYDTYNAPVYNDNPTATGGAGGVGGNANIAAGAIQDTTNVTGPDVNIASTPSWSVGQSQSQNQGAGWNQSIGGTGILGGLQSLYSQLLGVNQQRYGNVLNAYQGQMGNIGGNVPGIAGGYGNVLGGIQNTLGQGNDGWGVATPAAQAIGQAYAQQRGATTQQMTNAGLGNTTAVGNMQQQNALGAAQAYGGLGAQLAQTYAGYQGQEGNAALAALMQGQQMQTGLTQGALNPLGSQLSNTFGNLTGNYSASQGANYNSGQSLSSNYSAGPTQGAYAPGSLATAGLPGPAAPFAPNLDQFGGGGFFNEPPLNVPVM